MVTLRIFLLKATKSDDGRFTLHMISNQLNKIEGNDRDRDLLKKLGKRIKTLRLRAGHDHYEKFAFQNDIGRILLRRVELRSNVTVNNLFKIIKALNVTPAEFFSEGFD